MHRFGQVADRGGAQREVLDQTQYLKTVFRGYGLVAPVIFFKPFPHLRRPEILRGRQRHHQAAGYILGQAGNLVWKPRDILLGHVGQQRIDAVGPARLLVAFGRACQRTAVQRLV